MTVYRDGYKPFVGTELPCFKCRGTKYPIVRDGLCLVCAEPDGVGHGTVTRTVRTPPLKCIDCGAPSGEYRLCSRHFREVKL